uniref:Uncharacterized protein n=4 Tax=Triticum TaxID=4564 RepID=A0A8R7PQ35_TRIUA
ALTVSLVPSLVSPVTAPPSSSALPSPPDASRQIHFVRLGIASCCSSAVVWLRCPEAEPDLQLRHRRDMAAAAKEVDMKKMELMKEVRAHQVAIGELNNLPPSRAAYQKTCNIFFRKDIKSAVASQQKQLDIAKGKLQKLDQA